MTLLTLVFLICTTSALAKGPSLALRTSNAIVATWTCQTQLGVDRTNASSPWKPHSQSYRRWQLNAWTFRKRACLRTLHQRAATWQRLNRGLYGTPMQWTGRQLEAAGWKWHVSPYFIAAIAGTESSFGAAACSNNRYNAFGLSSCGSGWRVPYFTSWAHVYEFMAKFLTDRWPNANSTYDYHGYAACSSCWGASTARHMAARFGVGPSVRYP